MAGIGACLAVEGLADGLMAETDPDDALAELGVRGDQVVEVLLPWVG